MSAGIAHANVGVGAVALPGALVPPLIYQQLANTSVAGIGGLGFEVGQNIKIPGSGTTFKWTVDLKKTGAPTGNLKAVLYNCTAAGIPTTSIGDSTETFDISLFGTSFAGTPTQEFNWTGLTLNANTYYAVAIAESGIITWNGGYINMARDAHSNTGILDSAEVSYNGSSWIEVAFWDMYGEIEVT